MPVDNAFKLRQFEPELILLCVRSYLRYALSYRDLEEMMRDRGLSVDHTTIYRWVQRYAPDIDIRCRPFLRRTNDSYRIDETYVRVGGAWKYLYRGVDSNGDTLDFLLRSKRDMAAAKAFFRKTLAAPHTRPPRVINVDKNPAYPVAFDSVKQEGLARPRSYLRQCKYLNNIIEQDHRFIKRRVRPMLGFKRFHTAWRTLRGIEMMNALRKGQARWIEKGDVVGQTQLIHRVFGLAA
jgi:transposase-like protein